MMSKKIRETRAAVIERDGARCRACGATETLNTLGWNLEDQPHRDK